MGRAAFLRGAFYARLRSEHHVFRLTALSILLVLGVGPHTALLCKAWCDQQASPATACHHQAPTSAPSVAGDACGNVPSSAVFIREDVRQGGSAPDSIPNILAPRYAHVASTANAGRHYEARRGESLHRPPASAPLRI